MDSASFRASSACSSVTSSPKSAVMSVTVARVETVTPGISEAVARSEGVARSVAVATVSSASATAGTVGSSSVTDTWLTSASTSVTPRLLRLLM